VNNNGLVKCGRILRILCSLLIIFKSLKLAALKLCCNSLQILVCLWHGVKVCHRF